jgi:hypothetical protein
MKKLRFRLIPVFAVFAVVFLTAPMRIALAADVPIAPSQLEAKASYPGDLAISLTWVDNSFDETAWEIERCVGAGCSDFTLLATRDASIWGPWFNDVGLDEVTTYSYRVRAVNASGPSDYSNVAWATTSYARPDGQASNLVGTFIDGTVQLTWTENATNETRFEIERYEVNGGETAFSVIGTVLPDTTSYVDSTALSGTSYTYRVVPWRYDVFGGAPDTVTVQTGVGIAAPEAFKAVVAPPTSVRLSWKGTFAAGTQVVVQRENCDIYGCYGWLTIGKVDASTRRFTDSALSPAATYTYRIRAVSTTSVSPFTNSITVTTR